MSVETVYDDDGRLWVITGNPQEGYAVRPVGDPVATFARKFVARRAIRFGTIGKDGET